MIMNVRQEIIKGFSKKTTREKLELVSRFFDDPEKAVQLLNSFIYRDEDIQAILSQISENTISNYPLPYNVAPNFLINGNIYMIPLVTEESSVVAAASAAARFWAERGGFRAKVLSNQKNGQVHFLYTGDRQKLASAMPKIKQFLLEHLKPVTSNMEARGGGILDIGLRDLTQEIAHYFQLHLAFNTMDAMGANFINSCLEACAEGLRLWLDSQEGFSPDDFDPVMSILSNYNDQCLVEASVSCAVKDLEGAAGPMPAGEFASRFALAVKMADTDVSRATTHNKGIMNGVDAVILATGNDFRAIEAGAHAWAARSGRYRSLSDVSIDDGIFTFRLTMPMALGSVGGLTGIHPLAALSLQMLGNPGANELMMIAAAAGLANNYAAVKSLTTTGIQAGHMRMHLSNIIMQLNATPGEAARIKDHFKDKKISHQAVSSYLQSIR